MSNFLNSAFTDLNSLISINSDEVRTNTLYVNGIQITANSSNFTTINCSKLICQNDISSNTIYATTSIQNVPVAKFAYLTNVSSDIQSQFNNITTNYATKTQVTNNFNSYNTQVANTYATKSSLNNYVLTTTLTSTLTNYVSSTTLTNTLTNYCLQSDYTSLKSQADGLSILLTGGYWDGSNECLNLGFNLQVIGSLIIGNFNVNDILYNLPTTYVSYTFLTTSLSDYALISSLSDYALISSLSDYALISSLSNYVTNSALTTSLSNYVLNSQLSNYCLQSNYTALKSQADATTLLLTGGSWDAYYQYLNLAYNLHVYGVLYIGANNNLNVNNILTNLPTTYATITTLNQSLLNYVTNSSLNSTLNSYATNSSVDSKVNSVKSQSDANSALIATNTTAIAGLVTASASQQTQITTLFAAIGTLEAELATAEGQITTLQAKTALQTVVNAYTQFTGGIKIMNGLVYTSIINNNGSSDFYGFMNLREGLSVANGITSDRVTTSTELKSNGTLQVVGISTLSTTNITGDLTINGVATQTPNVTTQSNLTISNGKLTITGTSSNIINNDTIFNGGITATNLSLVNGLSLTELKCNNLNFTNSVGNNGMNIGTNGGSFVSPNSIYIGNSYSTTYLNGLVIFSGLTFNMTSFINQLG